MGVCTRFYQGVAFVCSGKVEKDWLDSKNIEQQFCYGYYNYKLKCVNNGTKKINSNIRLLY